MNNFFEEQIVPSIVYLIILFLILAVFICVRVKSRNSSSTKIKDEEGYKLAIKKMDRRFNIIAAIYIFALIIIPANMAKWVLICCVLIIITEGIIDYRILKQFVE